MEERMMNNKKEDRTIFDKILGEIDSILTDYNWKRGSTQIFLNSKTGKKSIRVTLRQDL